MPVFPMKFIRPAAAGLGLCLLFAAGLAVRRAVLEAQFKTSGYGEEMPFTLESALAFRLAHAVYREGRLPERDETVQFPEGLDVRETYTVGAEYAYAFLARLMPEAMSLTSRLRWITAAWFCLAIPALALFVWRLWPSVAAAGAAGAFYAVSLGSVLRSTGQELSAENFALPLLAGHLAADARSGDCRAGSRTWAWAGVSAALLACALAAWDLVQFYAALWAIRGFISMVSGKANPAARANATMGFAALAAVAAINPYLRAHHFMQSPIVLLAAGVAAGFALQSFWPVRRGVWAAAYAAVGLAPLAALLAAPVGYAADYGHFWELLKAKIWFLNVKPADPALLNFDQRILWTPALNSVDMELTFELFPVILPISVLALILIMFETARRRCDPRAVWVGGCYCVSLAAFFLFMRFQVFLALFACALAGWLVYWILKTLPARLSRLAIVLVAYGAAAEAMNTLAEPEKWGRPMAYYDESVRLANWFAENTAREPVLANFGVSAFLAAYAGTPVPLHPKFEKPEIRRRVMEYGEALFKGDEKAFRDWAEKLGVKYYVHSMGEFADFRPDLQMRYFVDALAPPPGAAARLFEKAPDSPRYFRLLYQNPKYRVFRIITGADEARARGLAQEAAAEMARGGDARRAGELLTLALMHDPRCGDALELCREHGEKLSRAEAEQAED